MNLDKLFKPRSIAVVGATPSPSVARNVINSLLHLDYPGSIFPINPKYNDVLGVKCLSSLKEAGEPVDLVVLCLSSKHVKSQLEAAADVGAGAAIIYGDGYGESGKKGKKLQAEIVDICRTHDIALCGPNCMGIASPHNRTHTYMVELLDPALLAGNVGLISHSGSVSIALTNDVRRFGYSYAISAGNEAVLTAADYLDYLIEDNNTEIIGLFLETVRQMDKFIAALKKARERNKPVIVLKTGKSTRAAAVVTSHTGGLAGEHRMFSALLKKHGAIEASSPEEMMEMFAVCQSKPLPQSPNIGIVTGSGGLAELMLDLNESGQANLPPLPESLQHTIKLEMGSMSGDGNPLDAWGNGDFMTNYPKAMDVFGQSPDHDSILVSFDGNDNQPMDYGDLNAESLNMVVENKHKYPKPHYTLSAVPGLFDSKFVNIARIEGIPSLSGLSSALNAIASVARSRQKATPRMIKAKALSADYQTQLLKRVSINEYDAKVLLSDYGVVVPKEFLFESLAELLRQAQDFQYPLVLKACDDHVMHRTEAGLVSVNIKNEDDLQSVAAGMQQRVEKADIKTRWLVQPMAGSGVEVLIGVKNDPECGPAILLGPGGIYTELMDEVSIRMLPLDEGDASAMISETRLTKLLAGLRGAPPSDISSLEKTVYGLADFAWANRQWIESIDLNPVIVHETGVSVVDALILPQ